MRGWLATIARARNGEREVVAYQKLHDLLVFFSSIPAVSYGDSAAKQFARLRRLRLHVGSMDLRIAAIALTQDSLLLSRNRKDFSRVPALRVEDWTV